MQSYPKMLNLFKFDQETKGRTTEFSSPIFKYLADCDWVFTEKIDGTNIRVIGNAFNELEVRGRTDRAELHGDLRTAVEDMFKNVIAPNLTFYGEGYGPGIQKGGGLYRSDKSFILFDIYDQVNERWLDPHVMIQMAADFDIPVVPHLGKGTLRRGYQEVHGGLQSTFGDFFAEGIVGRPAISLRGPYGERIIVKIKHRDYYGKELIRANS